MSSIHVCTNTGGLKMGNIQLKNMQKKFGKDVIAVDDFNLTIQEKEFLVLVGPSGCGKSTALRMIAGLEEISNGEIYIDGKIVNDVLPKDRDIAMVFQNYALYPHMTVYDNMAFGLKLRKFKKAEIRDRVDRAANILGLEDLLDRQPKALSGGQRQRVALGRAIVRNPKVFLMDEPLSNLDAKLRVQMRSEIQKLHQRLQTTTIYVTHDQTEAMTMATRLAVMKDGVIQQVGRPKDVYDFPENIFVGGFIGSPSMNFLEGALTENSFKIGDVDVKIPDKKMNLLRRLGYVGKEMILGIRPEDVKLNNGDRKAEITTVVDVAELMGYETVVYSKIADQDLVARLSSRQGFQSGTMLDLVLDMDNCHFFDIHTEHRIREEAENSRSDHRAKAELKVV